MAQTASAISSNLSHSESVANLSVIHHHDHSHHKSYKTHPMEFAKIALGILVCFITANSFKEEITKTKFGESNPEVFTYTFFLSFIESLFDIVAALGKIIYSKKHDQIRAAVSFETQKFFVMSAITHSTGIGLGNRALKYVDFPTQVLAKSCKMITAMSSCFLIVGKRYSMPRIVAVLVATLGISFYMFGENKKSQHAESTAFGLMLLIVSVCADGVNNAVQELMKQHFKNKPKEAKPSSDQLMFFTKIYTSLLFFVCMIYFGEFWKGIDFCLRHPSIILNIVLLCVSGTIGSFFIFWGFAEFDNVEITFINTVRKLFTFLLSVMIYGHSFSQAQLIGATIVFVGVGLDWYFDSHPSVPAVSVTKQEEKKKQ
ncbi:hypothetical protein FDP41_005309 [Naegleria fowleri]|uniref:Sugar phosphate transporter domain-containing protein n=1 Tax=Naegleria fowleri TaxID=5763 RepID=A0A6A5BM83_NAEFO|nr:uncharacterized protein FDP41_005309 [Naegleria fowleri]KAF0975982.1 hypothetical protein FDP41_005309 [Naegleria fowleri]CAG4710372.1 unnamed protein product [Naegleria fowleri]